MVSQDKWRPKDAITIELRGSGARAIISTEGDLMAGEQRATLIVRYRSLIITQNEQSQEEDEGVVEDASLMGPKQLNDEIDFSKPASKQ